MGAQNNEPLPPHVLWLATLNRNRINETVLLFDVTENRIVPKRATLNVKKTYLGKFLLERFEVPHPKVRAITQPQRHETTYAPDPVGHTKRSFFHKGFGR